MIGQTLGPYKILEQIGAGGMATVYKAYHAAMDRFVAIKVLPPNMAQDPQFITRFAQETRTVARLEHPFILPVYDSGTQNGVTYLVMRYMEAGTLADLLNKQRPDVRYSVRLVQRIAEALDYAHSQGIVHRDIKPNNILIDKNGQPYLTDFGIAKILEGSLNLTGSGIIGTPSYMSPEQGQGMSVDARSDIYALGVVLFEMVTGRPPFESNTPMGVMLKHIQEPLPAPSSLAPTLPPAVEQIIIKSLEKNREARYNTAGDLARALENSITGTGQRAATVLPSATIAVPNITSPGGPPRRTTRPDIAPPTVNEAREHTSSPNWLAIFGCGGLALIGVAALVIAAIFAVPGLLPTQSTNPGQDATGTFAAAYNSAIQTAQALSTVNAANVATVAVIGTPPGPNGDITETVAPAVTSETPTTAPSETPGTTGCNDNGVYVADVTIPDNSQIPAGSPFTKTWRVKNTGTCTWDTSYTLKFVGGVQMGAPGTVSFPGSVSPGSTMDISINLTAPNAPGTYTGQWRLTNKEGNVFGTNGNPLTVVIVVPATPTASLSPTVTPTATLMILVLPVQSTTLYPSSQGAISGSGSQIAFPNFGDQSNNQPLQAFLTFDLTSIPSSATISGVRLDLSSHDQLGDPFNLGCVRAYEQNFGLLTPSDFYSDPPSGALWRFCSTADLSDTEEQKADSSGIQVVQTALASGQLQLRLQFNDQVTNNNNTADVVRTTPSIIITYTN